MRRPRGMRLSVSWESNQGPSRYRGPETPRTQQQYRTERLEGGKLKKKYCPETWCRNWRHIADISHNSFLARIQANHAALVEMYQLTRITMTSLNVPFLVVFDFLFTPLNDRHL